jgi:hypothetical protein
MDPCSLLDPWKSLIFAEIPEFLKLEKQTPKEVAQQYPCFDAKERHSIKTSNLNSENFRLKRKSKPLYAGRRLSRLRDIWQ